MTNHHIHAALASQKADEIARHPRSPQPRRDWSSTFPVLSVLGGFLGLLVIAAPSL